MTRNYIKKENIKTYTTKYVKFSKFQNLTLPQGSEVV